MEKNKRKSPAAAVKRTQSLHAPVPSHTNQDGSPVPSCISAPGHGTNTAREVDGSPVDNSKLDGSPVDNSMANGSPVDNTNASLDTAEVRSVQKVDAASVTSEGNVNDKCSVFTRLTLDADSLGDDPPAVAPPVESTPYCHTYSRWP
ncbi:hypothetical protein OIU77_015286 [Salix suchowensis]|uniref:Uncharacterized protein n=1 Tax=Salix suchowensis TaxID=1278906 RepID=A0ABQ8ZSG8_9ROSI|nr:hypothetical protein OIU77_015286 [Salix suchowensis]